MTYYVFTLVFFCFDYFILAMGLNVQYGEAGILNFAYIGFVAIGAYFTGVFSLHSSAHSGQFYILGLGLPFPLNLLLGGLATMCFAFFVALITLRRLRTDYLAIVLISLSLVLYDFCNNFVSLFNGADGLYNVPEPFAQVLGLNVNSFIPFFMLIFKALRNSPALLLFPASSILMGTFLERFMWIISPHADDVYHFPFLSSWVDVVITVVVAFIGYKLWARRMRKDGLFRTEADELDEESAAA